MKLSRLLKIASCIVIMMFTTATTNSFAAMPVKTVILSDAAYNFTYFNNNLAPKLDVAAAIGAKEQIYVKIGTAENPIYYNVMIKSFAEAQNIPAVTYYAADGTQTPYAEGDKESEENFEVLDIY